MAETHVLSALTKKRAELLGDIRYYKKLIYDLDKDLANVDATIRIFEPNFKFGAVKPINKRVKKVFFQTGEAKTLILDELRTKDDPIRTDDIALILAHKKQLTFKTNDEQQRFKKAVITALKNLESYDLIERDSKDGTVLLWSIKPIAMQSSDKVDFAI